ncbi:MAG: DUF4832 domain-containing protein [bacterium]|nr:DUF4832 domain-containing protein [bacterium]
MKITIGLMLIMAAVFVLYKTVAIRHFTYQYERIDDILYNPMMGFAPNADYLEAVGENTLVYVDITWRELEPKEGKYEFKAINDENLLDHWREEGKKVVFRFMCDVPGEEAHMDIPDWLYEKTGDGAFYSTSYGKGYAPEYDNSIFMEYHKKAIKALGEQYGQDSFFCFVELGSLGHWGEWHVKCDAGIPLLPREEICNQYVKHYVDAFPNAKLLMRRPFTAVTKYGLGVYNDMTGEVDDTNTWLDWIQNGGTYTEPKEPHTLLATPKIWSTSPVGGEFTSSQTMETMLTSNLTTTLELLDKSHMTFIGPKCPISNEELVQFPKEVGQVLNKIGYRYGVSKVKLSYDALLKKTKVNITLNNYGVAPMYQDWPVYLYVLSENHQVVSKQLVKVNLTQLGQNESKDLEVQVKEPLSEESVRRLAIGIEDPETNKPAVALDMDVNAEDKMYFIVQE